MGLRMIWEELSMTDDRRDVVGATMMRSLTEATVVDMPPNTIIATSEKMIQILSVDVQGNIREWRFEYIDFSLSMVVQHGPNVASRLQAGGIDDG